MKVVHNKLPTTVCGFDAWQRRKLCPATIKIFPSIDRYPLSLLPHYIIVAPTIFSIDNKTKSMPLAFTKVGFTVSYPDNLTKRIAEYAGRRD